MNSYNKKTCRLCYSTALSYKFGLTKTAPANNLLLEANLKGLEYDLDIYQCKDCGHIQLGFVVDPHLLYDSYVYTSGISSSFVDYLDEYAKDVVNKYNITEDDYIVEIASNDGTFLNSFKKQNITAIGVDPAKKLAKEATSKGLVTIGDMYGYAANNQILGMCGNKKPKVIVANNVFAHIDELTETFLAINKLLDKNGVLIFEVGYFVDVFVKGLFDTIYHEHLSYHTIKPLVTFLSKFSMEIFDIKRTESQGGTIRVSCQFKYKDKPYPISDSVLKLIKYEHELKLYNNDTLIKYYDKIENIKKELHYLLHSIKNKTVAIYGAPAKATTLLTHFNITNYIDYIVDDNILKQGLYIPGTDLRIYDPIKLQYEPPDYVLILAWNFAESIMDKLEHKYNFIIPIPTVRMVSKVEEI